MALRLRLQFAGALYYLTARGETEDVQLTQPIRDLATALNNNPVAIHNWVRNNIEYLPTYASGSGVRLG